MTNKNNYKVITLLLNGKQYKYLKDQLPIDTSVEQYIQELITFVIESTQLEDKPYNDKKH
jgi:hypothetical protein